MKITMLGTGNALVTECYNTCFVIRESKANNENGQALGRESCFLVDGGGGSAVLSQLKHAGLDWMDMRDIFVTHKHIDHLMGIIWMVRMITQYMRQGEYEGEANIYAHEEVISLIRDMAEKLLSKKETKFIGDRLHLIAVQDGEEKTILGRKVTFFDIRSTKAKQYGFCMDMGNGEKLTCCGDEPYNECERVYAENSKWLLHEAFCLYSEADRFHPYEKHHSTVKDACELAEQLHVKNVILYHTEDKNIEKRKELYLKEGQQYFHGSIFVPDDLETIVL